MASIFPANCELIFPVGTVATGQKDRLGNPILETRSVKVKASIAIDEQRQNKWYAQPGEDVNLTYYVGRCIAPKYLPKEIQINSKAQATITDLASGKKQTGEFTITQTFQTRWKQVSQVLGSRFEGYLIDG